MSVWLKIMYTLPHFVVSYIPIVRCLIWVMKSAFLLWWTLPSVSCNRYWCISIFMFPHVHLPINEQWSRNANINRPIRKLITHQSHTLIFGVMKANDWNLTGEGKWYFLLLCDSKLKLLLIKGLFNSCTVRWKRLLSHGYPPVAITLYKVHIWYTTHS